RSVSRTDQPTEKNDHGDLKVDELPGNAIQIVAFGDSMWDNFREEDGIAAKLADFNSNYEVYNMAFGASTATRLENNSHNTDKKTLTTLVDIACKHEGNVVPESYTRNAIEKCNFLRTNYFVIAYGINDLFENSPIYNPYFSPDKTCYTGALTYAVQQLKSTYPNVRVVIVSPTYINGNPTNRYGSVDDYKKAAAEVASKEGALYFDPVTALGMTTSNANDFLEDGVHLNAEARAAYAEALGRFILRDWER
ncbi:MAG: SGNH/GDSL hydrolase family protein, partial [Lachnospiraceae bacterium]|nr:SGNH/GDSL hydrolase family protein [Lachnospiraceae bacterium]